MDTDNIDKKLREARFFLDKMIDQENRAFDDREPFDFYLSAFLNAGRTVDYRLRHEEGPLYTPWRNSWDAALSASDQALIKFLIDDRNVEVHQSGSARIKSIEPTPVVGSTYSDRSGRLEISSPPDTPPGVVHKPSYYFVMDGKPRKATEACAEYLSVLDRMVAQFKLDHR